MITEADATAVIDGHLSSLAWALGISDWVIYTYFTTYEPDTLARVNTLPEYRQASLTFDLAQFESIDKFCGVLWHELNHVVLDMNFEAFKQASDSNSDSRRMRDLEETLWIASHEMQNASMEALLIRMGLPIKAVFTRILKEYRKNAERITNS